MNEVVIYFHLMLVDFISSLQLSSETVKRYVLNKPDRKLFGKPCSGIIPSKKIKHRFGWLRT